MARLKEIYKKEVVPALIKQFGYKSSMEVPRITKIVLNMGVGEAIGDKKLLENAAADMTKISGQKPVVTKARKAIAVFKIREGYPIGCMVTLRQERMWEFLDRFVTIALPRVRDFRGISGRAFDDWDTRLPVVDKAQVLARQKAYSLSAPTPEGASLLLAVLTVRRVV